MGFKDSLYAPFAEVDKRQGRGGYYDYIKWRHVADRMNETFDGRWSSRVVSETVTDNNVIIRIAVTVVDPQDGTEYTQEGYGGSDIRGGEEAGTAHKGAYSKALKDACRKWGVGLYLEAGESSDGGYERYSAPSKPPTPPAGFAMPAPISQPAPVANQAPPAPPQQTPPAPPVQAPQPQMPMMQAPPTPPRGFGGGMPSPVQNVGMAPPVAVTNSVATPAPIQSAPQVDPTAGADMAPDEPGSLSEVQKMAITHMAKARGANSEEEILATVVNIPAVGLTRTVPSVADLTYIEAVAVIKYIKVLNEKE